MRARVLGSTDVSLPVLGQGTWSLERSEPEKAIAALLRGFELGMTHVTLEAECHGCGDEHEVLGIVT